MEEVKLDENRLNEKELIEESEKKLEEEKEVLVRDNPELILRMYQHLDDLRDVIKNMEEKRGKIFIDWLKIQSKYLVWEETFNPTYLRAYKRSEIVLAHFGFNVGSEYGGMHYAVVMKDSSKSNPIVNVVPLTSLKEGETKETIHKNRVYLGKIEGLNEKYSVALPDQMRPISKIRIYKPKRARQNVFKLNSDQMDLIDDKIKRLYTKLRSNKNA